MRLLYYVFAFSSPTCFLPSPTPPCYSLELTDGECMHLPAIFQKGKPAYLKVSKENHKYHTEMCSTDECTGVCSPLTNGGDNDNMCTVDRTLNVAFSISNNINAHCIDLESIRRSYRTITFNVAQWSVFTIVVCMCILLYAGVLCLRIAFYAV